MTYTVVCFGPGLKTSRTAREGVTLEDARRAVRAEHASTDVKRGLVTRILVTNNAGANVYYWTQAQGVLFDWSIDELLGLALRSSTA